MDNLILSSEEQAILADLIGQELIEVKFSGWTADLICNLFTVNIQIEEVSVPTLGNALGDIVTLRITKKDTRERIESETVLTKCGYISEISRLESLVEIENPRKGTPIKILDIEIPAGLEWSNNIYNPKNINEKNNFHRALLGLQFKTDKNISFTFYSDSVGYFLLFYHGEEIPNRLKDNCEHLKILNVC